MNLPEIFLNNMKGLLGEQYADYVAAMDKPPISGIRLNPLKIIASELGEVKAVLGLAGNVPFWQNGYFAESAKVGKHPYHIAGLVYVQEPSSMLAVAASGLERETNKSELAVLDLCAAPGGKSGQIAELLAGEGVLVSNEIEFKRAKVLAGNIERMGYKNVIVTNSSPDNLAQYLPNTFDYIFVDAPCGGEGMFRKNPETISQWSNARIESNAQRQLEILSQADVMLKPGGKLIYSTCTFSKTEDEDVVKAFAKEHDYRQILPSDDILSNTNCLDNQCCRRIYPQGGIGEGQFVCAMQKSAKSADFEAQTRKFNPKKDVFAAFRKDVALAEQFICDNFNLNYAYNWCNVNGNLFILNNKLQKMLQILQKITILAAGVAVGSVENGRFVPHNNIFLAFGDKCKYKVNFALDDPKLAAYLHGEQLDKIGNVPMGATYGAVCVSGHSVGGVRISGNVLKNILPKGLRV